MILLHAFACAAADSAGCDLDALLPGDVFARAFAGTMQTCDAEAIEAWNEVPKAEPSAPWNEHINVATSTDFATFTDSGVHVVDHAGVPEIVQDGGKIWLYYVDGDVDAFLGYAEDDPEYLQTHGWVGLGAFALMSSTDGTTFEPEPDFAIEGLVQGEVVDPDITRLPDGTWRMVYVGFDVETAVTPGLWDDDMPHDVYVATSTDLVHWTQEPDPLLSGPYADPTVTCDEAGICTMVSFGLDYSISEDGGWTWDFQNANLPFGFGPEFVETGDGLRMAYNSREYGAKLHVAAMTDGVWTDETTDLLPDTYGEAPSFARTDDGSWLMYTHDLADGEAPDTAVGGH